MELQNIHIRNIHLFQTCGIQIKTVTLRFFLDGLLQQYEQYDAHQHWRRTKYSWKLLGPPDIFYPRQRHTEIFEA